MTCTATLETLTHTDDVVAHMPRQGIGTTPLYDSLIPDGSTVTRDGDRLLRADVTILTCLLPHHPDSDHHVARDPVNGANISFWTDSPGATPHRESDTVCSQCKNPLPGAVPCPTCDPMDELVAVSEEAGLYDDPCPDCGDDGYLLVYGTNERRPCPNPVHTDPDPCPTCGDRDDFVDHDEWKAGCPDCGRGRDPDPCPNCGAPPDGYGCHVDCPTSTRPAVTQHKHHPNDCEGCFDMFAAGHKSGVRDEAAHRPTVTDAEVDAAIAEAIRGQTVSPDEVNRERYRAILVAAARARQENP